MSDMEYLELPMQPTCAADLVNLSNMMQNDIPVHDSDKLHEILSMAIDIVHMNMSIELIDTTNTYNSVITGLNRSAIKQVK